MHKRKRVVIYPFDRKVIPDTGNPDNPSSIHLREVVHVTIKSVVIINGEEVEIKNLDDREALADSINTRVLLERNYVIEKPA